MQIEFSYLINPFYSPILDGCTFASWFFLGARKLAVAINLLEFQVHSENREALVPI